MDRYLERLRSEYDKKSTMLCFGMDPVTEKMKIDASKNLSDEIFRFFFRIFSEIEPKITAVKPNAGFFYQYGLEGVRALYKLIEKVGSAGVPVIVDAKVADIGKTSEAYARYVFGELNGDAVTLHPYMGYDSLAPFFSYAGKGSYVLALTSNQGAMDFQMLRLSSGAYLFESILEQICCWNRKHGAVGAVLGATQEQLGGCLEHLRGEGSSLPLLIPGVGAQGGSYKKIAEILDHVQYEKAIVRINASSSISYAYEKHPSLSIEEASAAEVERLLERSAQ